MKSNTVFFGVYGNDNLPILVTLQPCGTGVLMSP